MFGKATLEIPESRNTVCSVTTGLSDRLAMAMGRLAAWTLPDEEQGYVIVTLESGKVKLIGRDAVHNVLVFGKLSEVLSYGA
jgi:hypothetical protein